MTATERVKWQVGCQNCLSLRWRAADRPFYKVFSLGELASISEEERGREVEAKPNFRLNQKDATTFKPSKSMK